MVIEPTPDKYNHTQIVVALFVLPCMTAMTVHSRESLRVHAAISVYRFDLPAPQHNSDLFLTSPIVRISGI